LRAPGPRDQEARDKSCAARQRAGTLQEAAQCLGLNHQPEGEPPAAQHEGGLGTPVDRHLAAVPQHVEQREVA